MTPDTKGESARRGWLPRRSALWLIVVTLILPYVSAVGGHFDHAWAGEPTELEVDLERDPELDLDQCIQIALQQNAFVQAARENARAAEARRQVAFAAYLPRITGTASYTRLDEVRRFSIETNEQLRQTLLNTAAWWAIAGPAGTAAANAAFDNRAIDPAQTFNQARGQVAAQFPAVQSVPLIGDNIFEAGVVLTQPLFTGGKIYHSNKMAALAQEIHTLGADVQEDEVVLRVTIAYHGAVISQQIEKELGDLSARLHALRDSITGLLREDSLKTSARDLARVEIAIAGTRHERAKSHRGVEVSLAVLREAMGWDEARPIRLKKTLVDAGARPLPLPACEALALRRRPELAQVRLAKELGGHGVSKAKASFAPDIAAFAGFRFLGDDRSFANPEDEEEWFAGVSMVVPLFEGFSRCAKVREARSQWRRARILATGVERAIRLQVQEAYYSVQSGQRKLEATEAMVAAAVRLREVTTVARAHDISTDYRRMLLLADEPQLMEFRVVPDVAEKLEAEMTETHSRVAHLATTLEFTAAWARLARATGVRSLGEVQGETGRQDSVLSGALGRW